MSERCRRLQYSLGKQSRINNSRQKKKDWQSDREDGGNLGARNTCPEDSKELGSSDCISTKAETEGDASLSHLVSAALGLHGTEYQIFAVLTLELQHHITQVCLDVELVVRRQHQTKAACERGDMRKVG